MHTVHITAHLFSFWQFHLALWYIMQHFLQFAIIYSGVSLSNQQYQTHSPMQSQHIKCDIVNHYMYKATPLLESSWPYKRQLTQVAFFPMTKFSLLLLKLFVLANKSHMSALLKACCTVWPKQVHTIQSYALKHKRTILKNNISIGNSKALREVGPNR